MVEVDTMRYVECRKIGFYIVYAITMLFYAICRSVERFLYPNPFLEVYTFISLHILHIYKTYINPYYKRICNVEDFFNTC